MGEDIEKDLDRLLALRIEKLRAAGYSYDELLEVAANCWILSDIRGRIPLQPTISLSLSDVLSKIIPDVARKSVAATKSHSAKNAIEARHNKPGGSREKNAELLALWASGQYDTKERCAYEWAEDLGMSPATARKALQGVPDPNPWPGKKAKTAKK